MPFLPLLFILGAGVAGYTVYKGTENLVKIAVVGGVVYYFYKRG